MAKMGKRLKYHNDEEKPVTISMRLPKELHARLEQYAAQHRQSISELVRDGLEWRVSEGDLRGFGVASTQDDEAYYMSNTAHALADMRQALARQEAQIQAIGEALERQAALAQPGPQKTRPVQKPQALQGVEPVQAVQATHGAHHTPPQDPLPVEDSPPTIPPYDTAKHHLGKLCPYKDEWGTTGQSLRNADNQCLACKARAKAAKDARKRAEREAGRAATTASA